MVRNAYSSESLICICRPFILAADDFIIYYQSSRYFGGLPKLSLTDVHACAWHLCNVNKQIESSHGKTMIYLDC